MPINLPLPHVVATGARRSYTRDNISEPVFKTSQSRFCPPPFSVFQNPKGTPEVVELTLKRPHECRSLLAPISFAIRISKAHCSIKYRENIDAVTARTIPLGASRASSLKPSGSGKTRSQLFDIFFGMIQLLS